MQPPSYQAKTASANDANQPLLGRAGPSNAIFDQPDQDLPEDFKYGVTVAESAAEIRNAFVRKVYTILAMQILGSCVVATLLYRSDQAIFWVQQNPWSLMLCTIASLINLFLLYWKRHSHPANLLLLTTFTLFEAFTVGVIVAFSNSATVLQALFITLGIFLGLTGFTMQSKRDFSGMAPFLFGGLIALVVTGLVSLVFPFSAAVDFAYALCGSLLFSGYVVFDTYLIFHRLSPDEYIMGAINLYLDFINLFLMILRVLGNSNND